MDPATMALLLRLSSELGGTLVTIFRRVGKDREAEELSAILDRSDATWRRIKARADAAGRDGPR